MCLPQEGIPGLIAESERGDLTQIDREPFASPTLGPGVVHGGKHPGILLVSPYVGLSLIPYGAPDGISGDGMDHGIVEDGRNKNFFLFLGNVVRNGDLRELPGEGITRDPGLDGRSARAAVDDADRNVEHLLQQTREVVSRGCEFGGRIGRG